MTRILVVGIPRSGSTWVARVLASTKGATYLEEPDNHLTYPFAFRAKHNLRGCFYTTLGPHDEAPEYERLWREALRLHDGPVAPVSSTARRSLASLIWRSVPNREIRRAFIDRKAVTGRLRLVERLAVPERASMSPHLVVKSVHAPLSVEWIAARFPVRVVVVLRDLLNIVSSWVQLRWLAGGGDDVLESLDPATRDRLATEHDIPPPLRDASPLARGAWLLGMLGLALEDAAAKHPEWVVVRHEELCRAPNESFREAAVRSGLEWTVEADRTLANLNRPGSGTEVHRVASELPDVWRSRLAPQHLSELEPLLERFRLKT
jgi:Sulfotransferase family